jgi:branched-chain amino acid transport system permease protein
MVVLGGMGSLSGSILGAIILGFIPTLFSYIGLGEYKQIFYALMLILLIRVTPNGLFGMNELPKILSRRNQNNA